MSSECQRLVTVVDVNGVTFYLNTAHIVRISANNTTYRDNEWWLAITLSDGVVIRSQLGTEQWANQLAGSMS